MLCAWIAELFRTRPRAFSPLSSYQGTQLERLTAPSPRPHITAKKINNSFHVGSAFRLSHDPKARLVVSYQFVSSNAIICSSVIISLTLTLAQCPAWFFFVWHWLPWLSALLSHILHLLRYSLPADLSSAATSPVSWKCMCKGSIK